jgi:hypothetical protein
MTMLIHAEIHGLAGRAPELRSVLREHAERLTAASGSLGATAYQPLARPSDVTVHAIARSYRAVGNVSIDPARQG